jgi:hypothetical protein
VCYLLGSLTFVCTLQGQLAETRHEAAVKNNISKLTKEKGLEAERLLADVQQLKQENASLKLKCDGASSRKKILEGEVRCPDAMSCAVPKSASIVHVSARECTVSA